LTSPDGKAESAGGETGNEYLDWPPLVRPLLKLYGEEKVWDASIEETGAPPFFPMKYEEITRIEKRLNAKGK